MRVVGYHLSGYEAVNSDGETEQSDYLGFLLRDKPDTLKVFYNLDWAVARLCYLLEIPEQQLRKFWITGQLYWEGHQIFFVPHRYLSVKFGKYFGEATFSDAYQYDVSLPFEIDPLEAACKARDIGQQVYDVLVKLNLSPRTLSSPIGAYQKEILSTLDLPTHKDMPAEVNYYAHMCKHGGWQEAYQRGHFEKVWDYDLVSAFTNHTANLIDTRKGRWVKSDKFFSPRKAPYGLVNGLASVERDFNSVVYTHKKADYTPTGERPDFKTNASIAHMYDADEGKFKVTDGWYWFPDGPLEYPLKEHVERLFEWKQVLKGFEQGVIKRALVGLTGKLCESFPANDKNPFGKFYNGVWYSWVQDATKLQVADFVIENKAEDALLSIAVDGCTFSREIPIVETGAMGAWRLNTVAPAFVVSSGVGCIKGKEAKGTFALNYDWLTDQIAAQPGAAQYTMTKLAPVTIGNALKNHKLDHLGELEMSERAVVLQDVKRFYPENPTCGADLMKQYPSLALDMSVLEAENYFTEINGKPLDKGSN
jgi:hypothetical protein